ncbi:hypothetical protein DNH61_05500 [Paenibacillus sambharensis]|uniref:DUF2500 domain-containing protein n=1 Tax=Paenibacillus sambharensis TaxID=1803190 RepID=A0A2W1LF43_9BACL|nr:DUF2500 family protein [Paenibacillus sambharensis]PZD96660.1 hypothetical protein DNH61_05500 [Paenibacillus sambharensis]
MIKGTIAAVVMVLIVLGYFFVRKMSRPSGTDSTSRVATVRKKKIDKWRAVPNSPQITEYYVEFEIEGECVDIKVPDLSDYERLNVGETGVLTFQKNLLYKLFVDFKKISDTKK